MFYNLLVALAALLVLRVVAGGATGPRLLALGAAAMLVTGLARHPDQYSVVCPRAFFSGRACSAQGLAVGPRRGALGAVRGGLLDRLRPAADGGGGAGQLRRHRRDRGVRFRELRLHLPAQHRRRGTPPGRLTAGAVSAAGALRRPCTLAAAVAGGRGRAGFRLGLGLRLHPGGLGFRHLLRPLRLADARAALGGRGPGIRDCGGQAAALRARGPRSCTRRDPAAADGACGVPGHRHESRAVPRQRRGSPPARRGGQATAGECLFVFDGEPILYHLTGSCLPTRFAFPTHLNDQRETGAIGVDQVAELRRVLATRPAYIVQATARGRATRRRAGRSSRRRSASRTRRGARRQGR